VVKGSDVEFRSLETGKLLGKLTHTSNVEWEGISVECRSDLQLMATSTRKAEICMWNPDMRKQELRILRGHDAPGVTFRISPTGDLLSSSSWDGTSRLWDPLRGHELLTIPTRPQFAHLSNDDRYVATKSHPHEPIRTWEVIRREHCRDLYDPHVSGVAGFAPIACDGRLAARITINGLRMWDVRATRPGRQLLVHDPTITWGALAFTEDGSALLAAVKQGLQRWPVQRNTENGEWTIGPPSSIGLPIPTVYPGGVFRADGKAAILFPPGVRAVMVPIDPVALPKLLDHGVRAESAVLSPDGRWIASGGRNSDQVRVFDAQTRREIRALAIKNAPIVFSPDSRFLVAGAAEEFTCWRVEDWQPIWKVAREDDIGGAAEFAPDGSLLALTRSRTVVAFVDPQTGEEIATLPSQGKALGFSRDGRYFFSAGKVLDSIQVWDLPLIRRDLRSEGFDWDPPATMSPLEPPARPLRIRLVSKDK
jgi:WD40 repeat protein